MGRDNRKRIAHLLALGRGDGPEAETARRTAAEIAAKYGIDVATVEVETGQADAPRVSTYTPENTAMWRASLGWAVARFAGVTMIRFRSTWSVVGRPQDVATWRYFYARAEGEIDNEARAFARQERAGFRSVRTEADTFRKGAARGFGERLAAYRAESERSRPSPAPAAPAPSTSTALVMVGRDLAVAAAVKQAFPKLRTIGVSARGSFDSYARGRAFGRNLGVHRGNLEGG